jgi:hypothetical protein
MLMRPSPRLAYFDVGQVDADGVPDWDVLSGGVDGRSERQGMCMAAGRV